MPHYAINQFSVASEVELPCNPHQAVEIVNDRRAPLSVECCREALGGFARVEWVGRRGAGFVRSYDVGSGVLVCLADCLRMFMHREGQQILLAFDAAEKRAAGFAAACVVNLGVSVCSLLRGTLPLHGAGVEIEGRRIAVMAPSGAGKPTLLWALLDFGARFANDDVVPVWSETGTVIAAPSGGLHAKLSSPGLEARGMEPERYQRMLPGADEFWVPIDATNRVLSTDPLTALFVLQPLRSPLSPVPVMVRRVVGGAALGLLMEHTQGLWAVCPMVDARRLLAEYRAVLRHVPIFTLEYYRCFEVLPALVDTIREIASTLPREGAVATPSEARPTRRAHRSDWGQWWRPWRRAIGSETR
jgi:hypothetical protein